MTNNIRYLIPEHIFFKLIQKEESSEFIFECSVIFQTLNVSWMRENYFWTAPNELVILSGWIHLILQMYLSPYDSREAKCICLFNTQRSDWHLNFQSWNTLGLVLHRHNSRPPHVMWVAVTYDTRRNNRVEFLVCDDQSVRWGPSYCAAHCWLSSSWSRAGFEAGDGAAAGGPAGAPAPPHGAVLGAQASGPEAVAARLEGNLFPRKWKKSSASQGNLLRPPDLAPQEAPPPPLPPPVIPNKVGALAPVQFQVRKCE